jgi:hypothetical protein
VLGSRDERGLHAIPARRSPQAQPNWVVVAAAEAIVIRTDEANRITCR